MSISTEQLEEWEADARGFSRSAFRYEEDRDGCGWGSIVSDDAESDEPFRVDATLDEHVAEPLARMLNAVGPLCAEVRRLRAAFDGAEADRAVAQTNELAHRAQLEHVEDVRDAMRAERDAARRERDEARADLAKLSTLYTECELALHEVVPPMADASHFREAVNSVVARVHGLRRDLDAAVTERDEARAEARAEVERLTARLAPSPQGDDYIDALTDALEMVREDRNAVRTQVVALRELLGEAHSHLRYHREELGLLRFDEPSLVDRIKIALAVEGKE